MARMFRHARMLLVAVAFLLAVDRSRVVRAEDDGPGLRGGQIPGDFDGDTDTDLADYAILQMCLDCSGPGRAAPPACLVFDLDHDQRVSLKDVAALMRIWTGPGAQCHRLKVAVDRPGASLALQGRAESPGLIGIGTTFRCQIEEGSYDPFELSYSWFFVEGPLGSAQQVESPPGGLVSSPYPPESLASVFAMRNVNGLFAPGSYVFGCEAQAPDGTCDSAIGVVTLYLEDGPQPVPDPSLAAPVLVGPPDGSQQWPTALLDWLPVSGATLYDFQVSGSPDMDNAIGFAAIGRTSFTQYLLNLTIYVVPGPFYWRVRAMSDLGVGPWSPVWSFDFPFRSAATESTSAEDGWNQAGSTRWRTEDGGWVLQDSLGESGEQLVWYLRD